MCLYSKITLLLLARQTDCGQSRNYVTADTYPETIVLAQFIAHRPRTLLALERPDRARPVHSAIAALLGRAWLEDAAFYPDRFNSRINYAPSPHPGTHPTVDIPPPRPHRTHPPRLPPTSTTQPARANHSLKTGSCEETASLVKAE